MSIDLDTLLPERPLTIAESHDLIPYLIALKEQRDSLPATTNSYIIKEGATVINYVFNSYYNAMKFCTLLMSLRKKALGIEYSGTIGIKRTKDNVDEVVIRAKGRDKTHTYSLFIRAVAEEPRLLSEVDNIDALDRMLTGANILDAEMPYIKAFSSALSLSKEKLAKIFSTLGLDSGTESNQFEYNTADGVFIKRIHSILASYSSKYKIPMEYDETTEEININNGEIVFLPDYPKNYQLMTKADLDKMLNNTVIKSVYIRELREYKLAHPSAPDDTYYIVDILNGKFIYRDYFYGMQSKKWLNYDMEEYSYTAIKEDPITFFFYLDDIVFNTKDYLKKEDTGISEQDDPFEI